MNGHPIKQPNDPTRFGIFLPPSALPEQRKETIFACLMRRGSLFARYYQFRFWIVGARGD